MNRFVIPLGIFALLVAVLYAGLQLNPRLVPSPLVGKQTPEFSLPRLKEPEAVMTNADIAGRVSLLNVWATWCVGCREEHPLLIDIAKNQDIDIYGLNHKDERSQAIDWLQRFGDPYVASAFDVDGKVSIDLGVYGLPETFVLDPNGVIVYKHVGPITPAAWNDKILPVLKKLKGVSG